MSRAKLDVNKFHKGKKVISICFVKGNYENGLDQNTKIKRKTEVEGYFGKELE